jgi:two-component system sensor histidine kinase DevS
MRATDLPPRGLQILAIAGPLAYIAALITAVVLLDLPAWARIAGGIAVSAPAVALFATFIFSFVARTREELVRRERRFRSLLESAPDAIVISDRSGKIVMVNQQAEQVFGYGRGELIGLGIEDLVPDDVREQHVAHRAAFTSAPSVRPMGVGLDLRARRKDGSLFPAEISLSPIESDEGLLVTSVVRDVTERRRAEEERERLMAEREAERERQRIGMDLHDGIIQSIYAVGLNLEEAAVDVREDPDAVQARIDKAIDQLNDTIRDIRSYIFELRPTRFSGDLPDSLQALVQEFRVNSLVDITLTVEEGLGGVNGEQAMALFHIAQEALNNVRKHARATAVTVRLGREDGGICLEVRDNGAGFDPAAPRSDDHRGLRNIASRAEAAGATLLVDSKPGEGTRVRVLLAPAAVETGAAT